MQHLLSQEGITFGNADALPHASVLDTFSFGTHQISVAHDHISGKPDIANVPGYPDCVVRMHSMLFPIDLLEEYAQRGRQHFALLENFGIRVPAQRFVLGPNILEGAVPGDEQTPLLYSFTERLQGRPLTYEPEDNYHNTAAIRGVAEYIRTIWHDKKEKRFLGDILVPRQFTVEQADISSFAVTLHDTDLSFGFLPRHLGAGPRLQKPVADLHAWASKAGVEPPIELQSLTKLSRSFGSRLLYLIQN